MSDGPVHSFLATDEAWGEAYDSEEKVEVLYAMVVAMRTEVASIDAELGRLRDTVNALDTRVTRAPHAGAVSHDTEAS